MFSRIGDYQVLDEVGRGGIGVVYRALDPVLRRTVAIKAIHAGNPLNTGNLKERFLRETRSNALLSHPEIVAFHHMAGHDNCVYIVMEFIDGPTLPRPRPAF